MNRADRVPGPLLLALAAVYALLARGYTVSFLADPLGPRAAPFLLAVLMAIFGVWLMVRPVAHAGDGAPPSRRAGLAVVAFVGWAALLPWLGFVLTTALFTAFIAKLAAGPPLRAAGLGALFAGTLYYVFVFALDVPLPVGRAFPFLGG